MGKVTVVKGSKVIDSFLQSGHVTFDLYWPVRLSTTIDWFLWIYASQLSFATILSSRPLDSTV